jgi:hypothetical protein
MPYAYQGDYYAGDYYAGDGILSSVGKFVTGAAKSALKLAFPVPAAVATAITAGKMVNPAASPLSTIGAIAPFFPTLANTLVPAPMPPMLPMVAPPMALGGYPTSPLGTPLSPVGMAKYAAQFMMTGYHPNKSTYATRGGGTSRWGPAGMIQVHPKGTVLVKRRRMNVANPRALRRGLRRAAGFVKLARRAHVKLAAFTGRGKTRKRK